MPSVSATIRAARLACAWPAGGTSILLEGGRGRRPMLADKRGRGGLTRAERHALQEEAAAILGELPGEDERAEHHEQHAGDAVDGDGVPRQPADGAAAAGRRRRPRRRTGRRGRARTRAAAPRPGRRCPTSRRARGSTRAPGPTHGVHPNPNAMPSTSAAPRPNERARAGSTRRLAVQPRHLHDAEHEERPSR